MRYFFSDLHMGHKDVINFERHQFKTIEEHDNYIGTIINQLANKIAKTKIKTMRQDEVWILGDYGSIDYLYCRVNTNI